MLKQLDELQAGALAELAEAGDLAALENWRVKYLGKKSPLISIMGDLGKLPREERPAIGRRGNEVKLALEAAFREQEQRLKTAEVAASLERERVDVTLPGRPPGPGGLHISTQTLHEIYYIFGQMGFQVYTARDVELDLYNFQLLNMPPGHPARDMWSTFYTTKEGVLLRTHTSPGQIHAMRQYCPAPIRVILPGKCYRYEQVTTRSEFMFYQVEGLAVGKAITMADLKGTFVEFARQMYGAERQARFRCSYFPFTEPSVEVDIDCILCAGEGCRLCKYTGWIEISGAGMVHPQVLLNGGYDPAVYSGFAFGMGVERIAMLKHGIDDIRWFYSNDLRFLKQFA
jgi:phenylalanyl-tRNA synthetase alpha chain